MDKVNECFQLLLFLLPIVSEVLLKAISLVS